MVRICIIVTIILSVFSLFSPLANADVTVERYIKSGGVYGMGGFEGTTTDSIKGTSKHSRDNTKFTGKVMGFLGGKGTKVTITRVNDDVVYELDEKNSLYTSREITIPNDEDGGGAKPRGDDGAGGPSEEKQSTTKVVKNEFKVDKTGEEKSINGFDCEQYILTWHVITEDVETKAQSEYLMTNDSWLTLDTKKMKALQKEELDFAKAYYKKMGMEKLAGKSGNFGLKLMSGITKTPEKQLEKQLAKMKGYPITSAVKWEVKSDAENQPEQESKEESSGGGGLEGLVGSFGKKLAKKMMKKDKEEGSDGRKIVFDSYSEIKSISADKLDDALFKPPAGYSEGKKKKFGLF